MSNFSNVGGVLNTKTFYDKMVYKRLQYTKWQKLRLWLMKRRKKCDH